MRRLHVQRILSNLTKVSMSHVENAKLGNRSDLEVESNQNMLLTSSVAN